jgi:hypothetical protein
MEIHIIDSPRKTKKFRAVFFRDGKKFKHVDFGAKGMSDFTIHKDEERKQRYIERHKKNEDWTDIKTAGYWARWALWNKTTLDRSLADIERRDSIKIINKT